MEELFVSSLCCEKCYRLGAFLISLYFFVLKFPLLVLVCCYNCSSFHFIFNYFIKNYEYFLWKQWRVTTSIYSWASLHFYEDILLPMQKQCFVLPITVTKSVEI
jgi:hypothetical protein